MSHSTNYSGGSDVDSGTGTNGKRRHSLIEMTTLAFSSYELPFSLATSETAERDVEDAGLDEYSLPSINTVTTSLEYGDREPAPRGVSTELERGGRGGSSNRSRKGQMSHGFFFGANSSSELIINRGVADGGGGSSEKENDSQFVDYDDDDDDDDDDQLSDDDEMPAIYAGSGVERWVRASQHSFKPSPEICKREVLSKRIKDVGFIGQNLGIGHLTGVLKEDAVLIPKAIALQSTYLYISESSPVQHDLRWSQPDNASTFSTLVYNIDVMLPGQEVWTPLSTIRHTVFRLYHTDHTLLVGKRRLERQNHDLTLWLRLCCQGEMSYSNGAKHWTKGPWSKDVELVFLGYGTKAQVLEQTAL